METREFKDLETFSRFIIQNATDAYLKNMVRVLKSMGKEGRQQARNMVGQHVEFSQAIGPFPAWQALKDATVMAKLAHGASDPLRVLYLTGELQKSFTYSVDTGKLTVDIGSTSEVMKYHEFGHGSMLRPVLGPIAYELPLAFMDWIGEYAAQGVFGVEGQQIQGSQIKWVNFKRT